MYHIKYLIHTELHVEHWLVTCVWSSLVVFPASEDSFHLGGSGGSLSDCEDREENSECADKDTDMVMIYIEGKKQIIHLYTRCFSHFITYNFHCHQSHMYLHWTGCHQLLSTDLSHCRYWRSLSKWLHDIPHFCQMVPCAL